MDWTTFISSLGGSVALIAIVAYLLKMYFGTKIQESVKNQYSKELENHKAKLQKQVNKSLQELKSKFQETENRKKTDTELFQKLLELLPSVGCIDYIKQIPMDSHIEREQMEPLKVFYYRWNIPEYEFLDNELEEKRKALHSRIDEFFDCTGINLFYVSHKPDYLEVPHEWRSKDMERYDRAVERLSELANKIVAAHKELVRFGKNKLNC